MKNKKNSKNSRRRFLKSSGVFVAGISLIRPLLPGSGIDIYTFDSKGVQTGEILPDGVKAVWDISKAHHETTLTRERLCINGLWKWQPGTTESDVVPEMNWGYFKVPGNWPGTTNYLQKESQTLYAHPAWEKKSIRNLNVAWYRREIQIPEHWNNRRILLTVEYLNSSALVFIIDEKVGEVLFPGGELDLTSICKPGNSYTLSIKATALPLSDVVAIFSDSNASRKGKGQVDRRGLCGDVFLIF